MQKGQRPLVCICAGDTMDHTKRYFRVRALASKIALQGGVRKDGIWEAPWLPACDTPVWVKLSTPRTDRGRWTTSGLRPYDVGMFVPCRKCPQCLRIRQMQWRTRILAEMRSHAYTWFITLTFSPAHLAGVLAEAQKRKGSHLTRVEGAGYAHVSAYLKRLRKGRRQSSRGDAKDSLGRTRQRFDPVKFRFFAASEYGEERGRLHFHLALHADRWTPAEVFTAEWRSRADAQMVRSGEGCATYLSKYLTKDQTPGRARASLNYGQRSPDGVTAVSGSVSPQRETATRTEPEFDPGKTTASVVGPMCPELDPGKARTTRPAQAECAALVKANYN